MSHHGEWSWAHIQNILNSEGHEWPAVAANIQRAIDDLPALGGKVWLPRATFQIDASINITKPVHVAGVFPRGTSLSLAAGADCDVFNVGDGAVDFWLTDLQLYGRKADQTVACHGIHHTNTVSLTNHFFDRINVIQFKGHGIFIEGDGHAYLFRGVYSESNDLCGIRANGNLTYSNIEHSFLYANANFGLRLGNSGGCRMAGNSIKGNAGGIYLSGGGFNEIRDRVWENSLTGITVFAGDYNAIVGAWVYNNDQHGILIRTGAPNTIIAGGTRVVENSQEAIGTYDGVKLIDVLDTVIVGCRIGGARHGYNVNESGTSDYTLLDGCNLRTFVTDAHNVDAVNSVPGDLVV